MTHAFPAPTLPRSSRAEVLVGYVDYFRERVLDKVRSLAEVESRRSRLPSGWTPLELVRHLTSMERRWLVWGFEGVDVPDPWGDERDGRWCVGEDEPRPSVLAALVAQGERTRAVVAAHDLDDVGRPGPRWDGAPPATLERVLLHVLQEYARHLGHLDVVVELAGGEAGE